MQSFDDFVVLFSFPLTVILQQFYEVTIVEISTDPILFFVVFENTVSLEYSVFKLTHVEIFVFEHLLTHTVELGVYIVSTIHHLQLELILVTMGVQVVASVLSSV